ncbi:MAG: TlyA family RNA methyltransferase [Polyangiaceae bacterium]|nr:TlyA family RNA methyltransferase [Polyangiaceae bacterium]
MTDHNPPPRKPKKERADQLLVERGLVPTRSRAQALILAGEVFLADRRVEKAGQKIPVDAELRVREQQKYVSRGGQKLEGALKDLEFSPSSLVVADIGASTGGFTDCVLQHGARKVFAIDVGHGQLAEKLRQDPRVIVREKTNARHLEAAQLESGVELVVVDASFISLEKLLPAIQRITQEDGYLLALIKPQFEVGRDEATRHGGVIRDQKVRSTAIQKILLSIGEHGFDVIADTPCRVPGPKGNVEHFCLAKRKKKETP